MQQALEGIRDQDILERIKRLNLRQRAEVVDFIDFLSERRSEERGALKQHFGAASESGPGLQEVRRRLAKIPGKMSETVRALRDERG